MPDGLKNVRFHAKEQDPETLRDVAGGTPIRRGIAPGPSEGPSRSFNSDEAAARFYLSNVLQRDARPGLRALTAPESPQMVPELRMVSSQEVAQTKNHLVRFEQTKAAIPVFGSLAVVELDQDRELLSVDAEVAEIQGISAVARLSPAEAIDRIASTAGVASEELSGLAAPELTFFHLDEDDSWHLAYYVRKVPAAPPEYLKQAREHKGAGHGFGRSLRTDKPRFDYLVDAHDGQILYFFSSMPMAVAIPAMLQGTDEDGQTHEFWGNRRNSGEFELWDPIRQVKTFDFGFHDIAQDPVPPDVLADQSANLGSARKSAVSAHVNATRVFDFLKSILLRDGIDDQGMDLVSIVNCTYPADEPPPEWHNAVWYDNRMWYGQTRRGSGFQSFSRYLDVIAHELTHGITDHTCDLVYRDQSGALNESFSDIFGIIIKNWYLKDENSVDEWDWEIGSGLGQNGLPLRDMRDPGRTGDPDHMNKYLKTSYDNGGVHTNSSIHNKAAHNVLTARDAQGKYVFTPREVATLYYLSLTRLSRLADFRKTLQVLLDVTSTYYAGDAAKLQVKSQAIREAYRKVGIS